MHTEGSLPAGTKLRTRLRMEWMCGQNLPEATKHVENNWYLFVKRGGRAID